MIQNYLFHTINVDWCRRLFSMASIDLVTPLDSSIAQNFIYRHPTYHIKKIKCSKITFFNEGADQHLPIRWSVCSSPLSTLNNTFSPFPRQVTDPNPPSIYNTKFKILFPYLRPSASTPGADVTTRYFSPLFYLSLMEGLTHNTKPCHKIIPCYICSF